MSTKTTAVEPVKSLKVRNPELAAEFNEMRNGLTTADVSAVSKAIARFWWKCAQGHEWDATMRSRVEQNNKCPYCSGRKATAENNLLAKHPDIAVMFNELKNGTPASEITPTFNSKMHWICSTGHEFMKSPREVIRTRGLCAECNSLAFKFPELKKYFSPNNPMTFESLSYGSNKKVNWVCDSGHEYGQTISHKTGHGLGCPFCSGRYATKENNLALAYPEIAKQFDAEKSGTTPDQVTPKSNRQMWWNCDKGHSYQCTPAKKTREDLPYGCPFCSGYQIDSTNSLASLYPAIAKEFDEVANGITADKINHGHTKKCFWKCMAAGHSFEMKVNERTRKNYGCPYCSGRYATPQNNFALARPNEVSQFHPTKNAPLTVHTITPKSNKKFHWICDKGHEWVATAGAKQGCPGCNLTATSKIEGFLRDAIRNARILDNVEPFPKRVPVTWRKNSSMSIDIFGTYKGETVAIEYDGYYFHSGIKTGDPKAAYLKDAQKTQALLDAGYKVIRIREDNFNGKLPLVKVAHPNLLQIHHKYHNQQHEKSFSKVCEKIKHWLE